MSKDVNIHVKTTGAQQSADDINKIAQATEKTGQTISRAGNWFKEAFSKFVIPLDPLQAFDRIVSGIQKIISAINDWKKANSEAVSEVLRLQQTSAGLFDAFGAISEQQRTNIIGETRKFAGNTGIPFETAQTIYETYRRTYGAINPGATEQLAGFWATGSQSNSATSQLIRWMGSSGIKTPDEQGKIQRLIKAVSSQTGVSDEELIDILSTYSQRFKFMGWSPEESIMNIAKMKGASPTETTRSMRGLMSGLMLSDDPAKLKRELDRAQSLGPDKSEPYLMKTFNADAPFVKQFLFGATPAVLPQTPEETLSDIVSYKKTTQGQELRAENLSKVPQGSVAAKQTQQDIIRKYGFEYLKRLESENPSLYNYIISTSGGQVNAIAAETAAEILFGTVNKEEFPSAVPFRLGAGPEVPTSYTAPRTFRGIPLGEQIQGLERATMVIYNDNSIHYGPNIGESKPRFGGNGDGN